MISKTTYFKYYYERKITFLLLCTLTFIFIMLTIKSSDEPIITFLHDTFIEKYLYQFTVGNSLILNISIGFLISIMFYIIVVSLPERQRRKDIEPFINQNCESIIFSSYSLINEIIILSKYACSYKNLTEDQLTEVCKAVNPNDHITKFAVNITDFFPHHLGYKINNNWMRINHKINDTTRLPHIDSGILKRLYNIENNFLKHTAKDLAVFERTSNKSLEPWSPAFYSLYIQTKKLRDYYILYSGNKLKNDPWK